MAKKPSPQSAKISFTFEGDNLYPVLDKKNDPRMLGALIYLLQDDRTIVHLFNMIKEQFGEQYLDEALKVFEQAADLEAIKEINDISWQIPVIRPATQLENPQSIDIDDDEPS